MSIAATELKMNLGKYLMPAETEDIYYLTHRLTHSDVGTRKILSKLFTLFHLLDTTSLDCRKAIASEIADYEDAIMVETAVRSEMNCIVTRNIKDDMKSYVKVYEPSALSFCTSTLICTKEFAIANTSNKYG